MRRYVALQKPHGFYRYIQYVQLSVLLALSPIQCSCGLELFLFLRGAHLAKGPTQVSFAQIDTGL